jgi:uncharacterized protein YjiS (DUF1127 family)
MTTKIPTATPIIVRLVRIADALATLGSRVRKLPTTFAHRGELQRLAECDDHVLADVGVTRDDLTAALSAPFWRDPSEQLECLSELTHGRPRIVGETGQETGRPVVTSPELILAACNRRRLPGAPLYFASR